MLINFLQKKIAQQHLLRYLSTRYRDNYFYYSCLDKACATHYLCSIDSKRSLTYEHTKMQAEEADNRAGNTDEAGIANKNAAD